MCAAFLSQNPQRESLTDEVGLARVDGVLQLVGDDAELILGRPVDSDGVMRGCAELVSYGRGVRSCSVMDCVGREIISQGWTASRQRFASNEFMRQTPSSEYICIFIFFRKANASVSI